MEKTSDDDDMLDVAKTMSKVIGQPISSEIVKALMEPWKRLGKNASKDVAAESIVKGLGTFVRNLIFKWKINLDAMTEEEVYETFIEQIKNMVKKQA